MSEELFDMIGPAVNSASGLFLYGAPGNGKSTIARCLTHCFGQEIWIPCAIMDGREIITLFDPAYHEIVDQPDEGLSFDRRWVRVRRPTVIVGGELRTLTSARREMNAGRNPERTRIPENHEAALRSFGLSAINAESWEVANREAGQLASAAISLWTQPLAAAGEPSSPEWKALLDQLGISSESVSQVIPNLLDGSRTRRMDAYANSVWQRLSRDPAASVKEQVSASVSQDAVSAAGPDSIAAVTGEIRAELAIRLPLDLQLVETFLRQLFDTRMR